MHALFRHVMLIGAPPPAPAMSLRYAIAMMLLSPMLLRLQRLLRHATLFAVYATLVATALLMLFSPCCVTLAAATPRRLIFIRRLSPPLRATILRVRNMPRLCRGCCHAFAAITPAAARLGLLMLLCRCLRHALRYGVYAAVDDAKCHAFTSLPTLDAAAAPATQPCHMPHEIFRHILIRRRHACHATPRYADISPATLFYLIIFFFDMLMLFADAAMLPFSPCRHFLLISMPASGALMLMPDAAPPAATRRHAYAAAAAMRFRE